MRFLNRWVGIATVVGSVATAAVAYGAARPDGVLRGNIRAVDRSGHSPMRTGLAGLTPVGQQTTIPREFYFSRVAYSGYGRGYYGRGRTWAIDFPKADRQFLIVLKRLVNLDMYEMEHPVVLDDPGVRRFPFLYALEVGGMALTHAEVQGLRSYLLAGGFLVIDDFWGSWEWDNFENEMRRVLPEYPIVELDLDHPLFSAFYDIDEILQVPGRFQGRRGGRTWEGDGRVPHVRGIFDEHGRLMVVINWNTDLGDAWEWADDPYYPLKYSTYAYEMGVNMIVYAMSH